MWQPVPSEPSADLWSAVTNPSVYVQFAWSAKDKSLLQASAGVPLADDLTAVEKLTKTDYQNIAIAFLTPLDGIDVDGRTQALESSASGAEFTRLMRDKGLLGKMGRIPDRPRATAVCGTVGRGRSRVFHRH